MKRVLFFLLPLVFFSCGKEVKKENGGEYVYESIKIEGKTIGGYHNSVLELNLERAKDMYFKGISDKEILKALQDDLRDKVMKDLKISKQEYTNFVERIGIAFSDEEYFLKLNKSLEKALSEIEKKNKMLSDDLKRLVKEASYDRYSSYLELTKLLKDKYQGSNDYNFIAMVIDVSLSSSEFWSKKRDFIYVPISDVISDKEFGVLAEMGNQEKPNYNSVWQADVSGAIIGGSWGAVTGSFAGGLGALPGALVGGGIASSYGSAAAGIWWYFNNRK